MHTITLIQQDFYGRIEVEDMEDDIVQIWSFPKGPSGEANLVNVEREKLEELISALQDCLKKSEIKFGEQTEMF